ncbi:hypothetical protein PMAYCL1PPCAC_29531, partial [Pristionchus mayeri]
SWSASRNSFLAPSTTAQLCGGLFLTSSDLLIGIIDLFAGWHQFFPRIVDYFSRRSHQIFILLRFLFALITLCCFADTVIIVIIRNRIPQPIQEIISFLRLFCHFQLFGDFNLLLLPVAKWYQRDNSEYREGKKKKWEHSTTQEDDHDTNGRTHSLINYLHL